jgi:S-ribosylhomocysteine lyase LuxS involved in autoinducer biosynthesis
MLIQKLKEYYMYPNYSNLECLFKELQTYDICNFKNQEKELLFLWTNKPLTLHTNIFLPSNGTTSGQINRYKFGPHIEWIEKIERILRKPKGEAKVIYFENKFDKTKNNFNPNFNKSLPNEPFYNYFLTISSIKESVVDFIVNKIEDIATNDKVIFWSNPRDLSFLMNSELFFNFCKENKEKISITSTCTEPFYKKQKFIENGIHVNDHMVDWSTGINFYRCQYNGTHFFPIFARKDNQVVNLLNLSADDPVEMQDHFEILNSNECECGKTKHDIKFIPHLKTVIKNNDTIWYNPEFAEKLQGDYQNLQFIQEDDTINVLYSGEIEKDMDIIKDEFFMIGLKVKFFKDISFVITTKNYAFYNNKLQLPYNFFNNKIKLSHKINKNYFI